MLDDRGVYESFCGTPFFKQENKTNLRWECFASIKDQLYDMFALAMVCKIYFLSLW